MNVEIITIGNELLIGQVVDTNSAWIGQKLNEAGFDVTRITSIQDTKEAINSALNESTSRSQIILLTGGLGPTKDDITKETLAEYFNSKMVFNQSVYDNVTNLLKGRVKNINKLNKGQAFVPECCQVINNPVGTAPVMWFNEGEKIIVSMPGVPNEMKTAMNNEIIPRLKSRFETGHILHKTFQIFNVPEAVLAEQLEDWENTIPEYITLAYLPSPGKIRLRLTAKTNDKALANLNIEKLTSSLHQHIGEHIFSQEDKPIEELLADKMKQNKKTIAVAESCTGGRIGHLITSVPGSSEFFKGGVIAYDNSVKANILGVKEEALEKHGAVSKDVVEQMAQGVKDLLQSDYAIATSGIAGPDGGTKEKPVGTVWIAVASSQGVQSYVFQFRGARERNIYQSADTALIHLVRLLDESSAINL